MPEVSTSRDTGIGYITRERSLRDLHTRGPQARGNVNHRRDRLPSDATYTCTMAKALNIWLDLKIGTPSGPS